MNGWSNYYFKERERVRESFENCFSLSPNRLQFRFFRGRKEGSGKFCLIFLNSGFGPVSYRTTYYYCRIFLRVNIFKLKNIKFLTTIFNAAKKCVPRATNIFWIRCILYIVDVFLLLLKRKICSGDFFRFFYSEENFDGCVMTMIIIILIN